MYLSSSSLSIRDVKAGAEAKPLLVKWSEAGTEASSCWKLWSSPTLLSPSSQPFLGWIFWKAFKTFSEKKFTNFKNFLIVGTSSVENQSWTAFLKVQNTLRSGIYDQVDWKSFSFPHFYCEMPENPEMCKIPSGKKLTWKSIRIPNGMPSLAFEFAQNQFFCLMIFSYSSSHMLFGLLTFPDWRLRRTPPPRRAKAEADRRTSRVRMFYLCSSMRTQLIWTGTYTTYHMPSGHLLTRELREENSFVPLVNCFAWFYIGKIVVIELLKNGNRFYFW